MTTRRKIALAVFVVVVILIVLDIYLGTVSPGLPFCNGRGQCL